MTYNLLSCLSLISLRLIGRQFALLLCLGLLALHHFWEGHTEESAVKEVHFRESLINFAEDLNKLTLVYVL